MIIYLALMLPFMLLGFWAQSNVKGTYARWSKVRSSSGRTGAETARAILDRNGLTNVEVRHVPGELSDHYDPRSRTVNLSNSVFSSNSVAAVSVAAHEVGHAIQHQQAYAPLAARTAVFPLASFGSAAFMPLFFIGIIAYGANQVFGQWALIAAVVLFAFGVLFQLITLPVEFDASRRAKIQLQEMSLYPSGSEEAVGAQKVLGAAAMTYVVAALAALAQLAYYAFMLLGRR